jgi:hypothetical protein
MMIGHRKPLALITSRVVAQGYRGLAALKGLTKITVA